MLSKFPVIRRVSIYMVLSYSGLVLVNNSGYQLENMWIIYAPMFVGVYIFSRWIDSKLANVETKAIHAMQTTSSTMLSLTTQVAATGC